MNAVQCDWCGKYAPNPVTRGDLIGTRTQKLPESWTFVAAIRGGTADDHSYRREETGEFCSRECVSSFFAAPAKAEA